MTDQSTQANGPVTSPQQSQDAESDQQQASDTALRTRYCAEAPSAQTALDIFKGVWKSSLPAELKLRTGPERVFFVNPRMSWVAPLIGGFEGLDILELGPFEGYDSYMLTKHGAKHVTAVEANNINFLKCLVLKDTLEIANVKFLHGDFVEYLRAGDTRFDLIWAAGVLYHSERPLDMLAAIAARTDRVYIWTHVFDDGLLSNENAGYFDPSRDVVQTLFDVKYTLHYRSYRNEHRPDGLPLHYEGGTEPFSYWMSYVDMARALASLGFDRLLLEGSGTFRGMRHVAVLAQRTPKA